MPPNCHATKSDEDVLGMSVVLSFESNVGSNMRGAYFAMTGAMGGWVTSATDTDGSKHLVASLGAPHFLADGTTLNTGSMVAFLPAPVISSMFGLTSGDLDTTTLDITRTSGTTTTTDVPFTIASVPGGVTLTVPTITFSSPKYTIKMTAAGLKKQQLIAKTPSRSKSTIRVIGSKVKANGTSTYSVVVIVRNKLGKVLTIYRPILTNSTLHITRATRSGNQWTSKVSAMHAGLKLIKITANGVSLGTISLNFFKK